MLNRFLKGKQDEAKGPKAKRPYLATECRDLNEADKWRQQILREVGRKVMQIQNAAVLLSSCRTFTLQWGKAIGKCLGALPVLLPVLNVEPSEGPVVPCIICLSTHLQPLIPPNKGAGGCVRSAFL